MIDILILDVGHGNSAVIAGEGSVVVIDAPPDDTLLRVLRQRRLLTIDHLLLSHADEDHIGGAVPLLVARDVEVRHVHVNPEAARRTRGWERLIVALEDARKRTGTRTHPELSDNTGPAISFGHCSIEVLFPAASVALRGVGGVLEGERLTANSMSAVVRVETDDGRSVLFAGDIDSIALDSMRERDISLRAGVLVYPHHGGRALNQRTPQDEQAFAAALTDAVDPAVVAFSLGRMRFTNPRADVIKGVRDARGNARIVCTQLSRRCAVSPGTTFAHLIDDPSSGATQMLCCAGSLRVGEQGGVLPEEGAHVRFIEENVENPMCLSKDLTASHGAAK